jgi:RHS repeat-associated protein
VTDYQYDSNDRLRFVQCKDATGKILFRHKTEYDFTNAVTDFADVFGYQYGTGVKYGQGTVIGQTDGVKYDHVYTFGTDAGTPSNPHTKYGGGNIGSQYGEPGYGAAIKYGQGTKSSALHYDNLSRITEYTDFFGNQYHYGYDELTRPAVVQYPNGIITQYGYDDAGRLHNITHKRETGETLRSFTYQYDLNRNITKITNEDGSYTDYNYDDWNRLTRETWKNAVGMTTLDIVYSFQTAGSDQYGDTGNICSKTVTRNGGTPETTTFTYDEYNKLTTVQHPGNITETLTYNANGQLTQSTKTTGGGGSETTKYYWNDQGFLTKVLLPSGEPVEYKYDGAGRLVGRKDADGEQIFVQAGWSIMTEQDTEGRRTYYTGSSAVKDNSSTEGANFFLFNHRGDTVLITDQTGEVSNNLHYEAYGAVTNQTGTPINPSIETTPNLFVGAYGIRYDRKTELSYMRFRWYSQSKMCFISSDKLLQNNRYTYSNGNPISFIDPTGFSSENATHDPKPSSYPSSTWPIYGYQNSSYDPIETINWIASSIHQFDQALMILAGTHATGVDLSLNAGAALMGNGLTFGVGLQILTDQRGKFHVFLYSQKGNLAGTGASVGPSLSVFYVSNFEKNKYTGRSKAASGQIGNWGIGGFWGEGENSPCGGSASVYYLPGKAGSTTDQFFVSDDQVLNSLASILKPLKLGSVISSLNGNRFNSTDPILNELIKRYYRWAFEHIFWF